MLCWPCILIAAWTRQLANVLLLLQMPHSEKLAHTMPIALENMAELNSVQRRGESHIPFASCHTTAAGHLFSSCPLPAVGGQLAAGPPSYCAQPGPLTATSKLLASASQARFAAAHRPPYASGLLAATAQALCVQHLVTAVAGMFCSCSSRLPRTLLSWVCCLRAACNCSCSSS